MSPGRARTATADSSFNGSTASTSQYVLIESADGTAEMLSLISSPIPTCRTTSGLGSTTSAGGGVGGMTSSSNNSRHHSRHSCATTPTTTTAARQTAAFSRPQQQQQQQQQPDSGRIVFVDDDVDDEDELTIPSRSGGGGGGFAPLGGDGDAEMPLLSDRSPSGDPRSGSYDPTNDSPHHHSPPSSFSLRPHRERRRPSFRSHWQHHARQPPELNGLNYLNVVTYAAHLFVSWGVGVWGLDGLLMTRWEISTQYETVVVPAHWAYYLWAPILVLEGIFAVAQLLPRYRGKPIVQAGTGYFFFYTFLIQTAWTFFYSFELFILSFIAVMAALVSLLGLLVSQQHALCADAVSSRRSLAEYVLFRFPFSLHTGWMVLMCAGHLALMVRYYAVHDIGMQIAVDMVALAVMLPVATFFLSALPWSDDFVVPAVILWSYVGIGSRLQDPNQALLDLYGETVVEAFAWAAYLLAILLGCCLVPKVVIWACRSFCTITVIELDE